MESLDDLIWWINDVASIALLKDLEQKFHCNKTFYLAFPLIEDTSLAKIDQLNQKSFPCKSYSSLYNR